MVGYSFRPDNYQHAFLWTDAEGMIDLGVLSEMTRTGGLQNLKRRIESPGEKVPTVDP